jgi:hypothetical protein
MSSDKTNRERVDELLGGSRSYDEIEEDFDDEFDCYFGLLEAAKSHLRNFEDLVQFYDTLIEKGPTGLIYHDLKQKTNLSLKNMVLQDSPAGKRFPITSLSELDERVQTYRELGVEGITTKSVVSTTLEHIYAEQIDEDLNIVYEICDNLLYDSGQSIDGQKLLTHARFVSVVNSVEIDSEAFDIYTNEFLSDLPDPYPEDPRSPDELWERSEEAAYSETKKVELAQSSLVRQYTESHLAEYLYLDAIDTVERYRHDQRKNPNRAELQLCNYQIQLLQNRFTEVLSQQRITRLRSYRNLVLGQLNSGNWWSSQQDIDIRPTPNYKKSAVNFYRAAQQIRPIDRNRFLKYFSKAIRNAAIAARYNDHGPANGWETCSQLHDMARGVLSNLSADDGAKITETVEESLALHRCLENRAEAVVACYDGDIERIRKSIDEAFETLRNDEVPIYIEKDILEGINRIADALEYKSEGESTNAVGVFDSIEIPRGLISTKKPKDLEKIKIHIKAEQYDRAYDIAKQTFDEGFPIRTAVEILAEKDGRRPGLKKEFTHPIVGVDDASIWSLALLTDFIHQEDSADAEMSEQLSKIILDL